ncbi:uncharacterized protein BDR25DRAFT_66928 [Lindgomyces ingoldianus]|uniref:Uncharacterized protein n=1 Tax=Lindgomyces ingoldianus TaxID=673940 RepID=A0ACB6RB31_9PLEO|nr:uncharacterized protein BDR25DRAFT_66928 [Lindgomyces ingoldianus]KAF2476524.1 hypothetical protein BDR25DRAFT_66928 [Lindgomyces ingoldianus]
MVEVDGLSARAGEANGVPDYIRCGACNRLLGSTSPDGGLAPAATEPATETKGQDCNTCHPFRELYDAMTVADMEYASHQDRRPTFGPRQKALEAKKEAHRNYANLILKLEEAHRKFHEERQLQRQPRQQQDQEQQNVETLGSAKRPRSPSTPSFPEISCPAKRLCISGQPKKVTFDASVAFRNEKEYRMAQAFQRSDERYVRGRNAAPEGSEYLDTSGHQQDFKSFFREKWKGRKWVASSEPKVEDSLGEFTEADDSVGGAENEPDANVHNQVVLLVKEEAAESSYPTILPPEERGRETKGV